VYSFRDNIRALPKPAWILFGGTFIFERSPAAVWIACGILGITSAALMMRRSA